uniref:Uncharacterized protein n=1 Tax=Panagrolaimus davidi TaxID=227884 RepID=A0A914QVF1_9BILA
MEAVVAMDENAENNEIETAEIQRRGSHSALNNLSLYEVHFGRRLLSNDAEGANLVSFEDEGAQGGSNDVEGANPTAAETEEHTPNEVTESEEQAAAEVEEVTEFHFNESEPFQEQTRRSQKRQAEMVEMSAKRFKPLEIGENVRVAVAEVDRAKCDPRNVLGIVLEKQNDLYRVGTKHRRFSRLFARNL